MVLPVAETDFVTATVGAAVGLYAWLPHLVTVWADADRGSRVERPKNAGRWSSR